MRMGDGLWATARAAPDRPGLVVDGRERWSYGQLQAAVAQIAAGLRRLGLPRGGRLAICLPNGSPFLLTFLAAARYGWVAVTLPPGATGAELAEQLRAARPDALVAPSGWLERKLAALRDSAPGALRIAVGGGELTGGAGWADWQELLAAPGSPPEPAAAADLFFIGYTSGSTGQPRGVVRRHRSWLSSFAAATEAFGLGPADRFLVPGPLGFSASLFATCHLLEVGGTVYLETRFQPRRVASRLAEEAITGAFMVPTLYQALVEPTELPATAPALRCLVSCGEKLRPPLRGQLQRHFPQAGIYEYYGSSELGLVALLPPELSHTATAAGRPFSGVELAVRRPDGSPAAPGEVGTLYARSAMVAAGYDGPDGTVLPCADADGWATAGDLGWVNRDGILWLAGREDDAINVSGAKVFPVEVETVLEAHPAVAGAAACGRPHPRRGEEVAAAVALRADHTATRSDLRRWCAAHLAPHKRPRTLLVLPSLPQTATGKISRAALRALMDRESR